MFEEDDEELLDELRVFSGVSLGVLGVLHLLKAVLAHWTEVFELAAVVLPVVVAAGTGSMAPMIDGGDRIVHDAGVGHVGRGDVVVFEAGGREADKYVHRTSFYVEAGENWYVEADPAFVGGADSCEDLMHCPAPHSGWITKGDARSEYDQVGGTTGPVREDWIRGEVVGIVDPAGWEVRPM